MGQHDHSNPPNSFINEVKSDAKLKVLANKSEKLLEHVIGLIKQGHFLKITKLQQTDAKWKSYIFNLPRGAMKWFLISFVDTLPN